MEGERILVTGGTGFIGSHLVDALEKNNSVFVLDDLSSGSFLPKKSKFIKADVLEIEKLNLEVDYIFHLAAVVDIQETLKNPFVCEKVNVGGTLKVLEFARKRDVGHIIFSSSAAVYGDVGKKIKENEEKNPISVYGLSKLCCEEYIKLYHRLYGIKTVILRYFNVYGPRQNPHSKYAAVIPNFITRLFKNQKPIIYGDGNQTRDFIFVNDVVRANIHFANNRFEIFNIASGIPTTINKLSSIISSLLNKNIEPVFAPPKEGDIKHSVADVSKSKKCGFVAETKLEDGLRKTIEWFRASSSNWVFKHTNSWKIKL